MIWAELETMFMTSRRRGTDGAYKRCGPRMLQIYTANLRVFFEFMQTRDIPSWPRMRKADIMAFLDWLDTANGKAGKPWSKATKLQLLSVLRTFFIWVTVDEDCVEASLKNWRKALPAIQETPRRLYIPSRAELKEWRSCYKTNTFMGHRDYVMFMLMLGTGVRVSEVCNLKTEFLLLDESMMLVWGKDNTGPQGDGRRTVRLTGELVTLLRGYTRRIQRRKKLPEWSGEVFVSRYGGPMTPNGVGQAFRKHEKRFGLSEITPHTLRHAFCTYYLRANGSIKRLKDMTGHSSMKALERYIHTAEMGSDEALAELERATPLAQL